MTAEHFTTLHCETSGCRATYLAPVSSADLARQQAADEHGWTCAGGVDKCHRCSGGSVDTSSRAVRVQCPRCGAPQGHRCRGLADQRLLVDPHRERREAAR